MRQYFSSFEFFFLNRLGLWTLGMPGVWVWVTGETLSALAWPSLQSQLRERRDQTPAPGWHRPHPQTSMGGRNRKITPISLMPSISFTYTWIYCRGGDWLRVHEMILIFLDFFFSPLIPYIFHSVRSAVDVFLVPNIARHSEFYGKMLNHCGWKVWDQPRPKNQNKTRVKVETWLNTLRGSGIRRRGCVWWLPRRRRVWQVSVCAGTIHELCITNDTSQLAELSSTIDTDRHHHHIKFLGKEHQQ